jgi:hypothetical protein
MKGDEKDDYLKLFPLYSKISIKRLRILPPLKIIP